MHPPTSRPVVITIGGIDSSGMAGLHSDIKTVQAMGAHTKVVCSANTVQDYRGVCRVEPTATDIFAEQLKSAIDLSSSLIIKIGMLSSLDQILVIKELLSAVQDKHIIIDPVLSASSGEVFSTDDIKKGIVDHLLPITNLITPNLHEAQALSGINIDSIKSIEEAAKEIISLGAQRVLIKGGHQKEFLATQGDVVADYFHTKVHQFWLNSPYIDTQNSRGTGCAMASSTAAAIALDYSYEDAVVIAKMAINQGLRNSYSVRGQKGPINISQFPNQQQDIPLLTHHYPEKKFSLKEKEELLNFPPATLPNKKNLNTLPQQEPLGLYPIVDKASWLARLLPLGVSTIQLRIKSGSYEKIEQEIYTSIQLAQQYNARLFINDYWQLALKHGAYGVHLGQEDLCDADLQTIKDAGLRLGISTHCHYEVARAMALRPSYIACGPIYHTNTKKMPWIPHGLEGFAYWRTCLSQQTLVAIGGINEDRIENITKQGANGIALISAITQAQDPETMTLNLMKKLDHT